MAADASLRWFKRRVIEDDGAKAEARDALSDHDRRIQRLRAEAGVITLRLPRQKRASD